tara:strand:- start:274 stop:405 length:132 start_codon:yes stop_codon:yes gene_type:complete
MRFSLLALGWSRDEMKHLTLEESWKIIDRGISKKSQRERGRNQ